ncbi:MAG: stage V sporulation protein AD [Bacilli bacterium]
MTTWEFKHGVYVQSSGTAVGPMEGEGPLKDDYDFHFDDLHCGEESWEKAERALMMKSIDVALQKACIEKEQIDVLAGGDLMNQIITTTFSSRIYQIPTIGMFAACATSMLSLATVSALVDADFAKHALAVTSSHNATAEKQFRYPTEYGSQKPATATFTVTGAGAVLVSKKKSPIRVVRATIGREVDYGCSNPLDMGSAMAPAAFSTFKTHFANTNTTWRDYDLVVTGDLSLVGSNILRELFREEGANIDDVYNDCGLLVYFTTQEAFAGGSGCACSAVVTYGHLFNEMKKGTYKRILVGATGALMNPTTVAQKETIPVICHAVEFHRTEEDVR